MMRKHGFTLIELAGVLLVLVVAAVFLYPIFFRSRESHSYSPQSRCSSNLKQLGLGIAQYTQDYDNKFPIISVSIGGKPRYGWACGMLPYTRSLQLLQCPAQGTHPAATPSGPSTTPLDPQFTDYWFNSRLAGIDYEKLQFIEQTFLMGDGNDGTQKCDSRYALADLPANWRTDSTSPAFRHDGYANYAFADGHVKWLKPEMVTGDSPDVSKFTFLPGA